MRTLISYSRWALLAFLVALGAVIADHGLAAGRGNTEPGKKAARVIAILGQPRHAKLAPVDARTLKPIRGGWSVSVRWATGAATLSPSAKRAAVQVGGDLGSVLVVDTATGRVEHRLEVGGDTSNGLYWFGGNEAVGCVNSIRLEITADVELVTDSRRESPLGICPI